MSLRWKYETWRKLYVREEGSFAALPLYTRALAAELIKHCDEFGCIPLNGRTPEGAVAWLAGADRSDRRLLKRDIPALVRDGYLMVTETHLVIRNFGPAQEGHDRVKAPIQIHETVTTEQRQSNDGSTTGTTMGPRQVPRQSNEKTVSADDSNGTKLALIPYLPSFPLNPPEGEGDPKGWSELSAGKRKKLKPHLAAAREVFAYHRQQRGKVVRGSGLGETAEALAAIAGRLAAGHTVDDCRAVIDEKLREAQASGDAQWFNGVTEFRPENFRRTLGQAGTRKSAAKTNLDELRAKGLLG